MILLFFKSAFPASRIPACILAAALVCLASGCSIFKSGKSTHDLSRPSPGFDSRAVASDELKPLLVQIATFEDARVGKDNQFADFPGLPLFVPRTRMSSTVPPAELMTDAVKFHLKRKGFSVGDGSKSDRADSLGVKVDGKLWRLSVDSTMASVDLNVWAQIRVMDASGNVLGKQTIKSSGKSTWSRESKIPWKEQMEEDMRAHIDSVALQCALLVLNSQSKLVSASIKASAESGSAGPLTVESIKQLKRAIEGSSEDLETLSMKMTVSEEAAKASKAAQDEKIQNLMNLQQSLDGVRSTLPTK